MSKSLIGGLVGNVRYGARALAFGGSAVGYSVVSHPLSRVLPAPVGALVGRYDLQTAVRLCLRAFNVELVGLERPLEDYCGPEFGRVKLIVANHRSALDIAVVISLFGGHFLSRAEVQRWPLIGMVAKRAGTIFVDRDNPMDRSRALQALKEALSAQKRVVVFPEGRTYPGDHVQEFKPGAFRAAAGLDIDVLSVGLAYEPHAEYVDIDFGEHLRRVASAAKTRIGVAVGTPRPATSEPKAMAATHQNEVQHLVHDARIALEHANVAPR